MLNFRLYRLHPDHGHITAAEDLKALSDDEALRIAHEQGADVPLELWSGARKIGRIDGRPQAAAFQPRPLDEARG